MTSHKDQECFGEGQEWMTFWASRSAIRLSCQALRDYGYKLQIRRIKKENKEPNS